MGKRKPGLCIGQGHQWCLAAELAILASSVVSVLECEGTLYHFVKTAHGDLVEELLFVVVVELLDHAISPVLSHGDEPQLDSEMKAQAD